MRQAISFFAIVQHEITVRLLSDRFIAAKNKKARRKSEQIFVFSLYISKALW